MTFDFFEGAAGTGKTHNLVGRAEELVRDGVVEDGKKLLALTFMNGARRRLEARLNANRHFRGKFECQTFDVFARTITTRRRSLINAAMNQSAAGLNEFDAPCQFAGALLETPHVQQWVSRHFPLVLVDEAQDLDDHRFRILRGLAQSCSIAAAADSFQCLTEGRDTTELIGWLEERGEPHRLTQPRRTEERGLLAAALAVREGRNIRSVLTQNRARNPAWTGQGFRLLQVPAANAGLVAWTIANEMAQRNGQFAILTPDSRNNLIRTSLATVGTRVWNRNNGPTFGPFPHSWDRQDVEEVDALLTGIALPAIGAYAELRVVLAPALHSGAVAHAIARMDRLRRTTGRGSFSAAQVIELIGEAVRNQSRLGLRSQRGNLAMTIQRAKNREFPNVVVLWPHTAVGNPEHLRRLLYNAITRAQNHCSVIVLGQGRLDAPPFV